MAAGTHASLIKGVVLLDPVDYTTAMPFRIAHAGLRAYVPPSTSVPKGRARAPGPCQYVYTDFRSTGVTVAVAAKVNGFLAWRISLREGQAWSSASGEVHTAYWTQAAQ